MSLQEQIRALALLDQQVRGLRTRLDAAQRRKTAQQTKRDQLSQKLTELQVQHRQAQTKASAMESEANGVGDRVEKIRQQMNNVTSNKEYKALLVEMNTIKLDQSKLQDEALTHMTAAEELAERIGDVENQLAEQKRLLEVADREVEEARSEVGERLDAVTRERDEAASKIDPKILPVFEKLAESTEGEAVADVEEQDIRRREFICGGCFMQLPVELINALIVKPEELATCPNCQRILLMPKNLKEALAIK